MEDAITDIKAEAEKISSKQQDSSTNAKQIIDSLNQLLQREAKAAGLEDTMTVAALSEKESKDMEKVNAKLEEITAKINALREAMNVQDVVVKTWFESE